MIEHSKIYSSRHETGGRASGHPAVAPCPVQRVLRALSPSHGTMSLPRGDALGGRPTKFSAALADSICERLAEGQSLRQLCRAKEMPGRSTVLSWLAKGNAEPATSPHFAAFLDQYARACEIRADAILDEILEIADDSRDDYTTREDRDGNLIVVFDAENVQRAKLRIEARKWMLARMAPKKYGNRL